MWTTVDSVAATLDSAKYGAASGGSRQDGGSNELGNELDASRKRLGHSCVALCLMSGDDGDTTTS